MKAYPVWLPNLVDFAHLGILTLHGDPVAPGFRRI